MPPNPQTPTAAHGVVRRQTRTREAILQATEAVLESASIDDVSVSEIARLAGVSRASVFGHFGTKDALVSAVVERIAEAAISGMEGAYGADGTAFDRVMASGTAYLDLLVERPALLRHLISRGLRPSVSTIDHRIDDLVDTLRVGFENQIRAALEAAEISPVDPRLLSHFLFGAWPGAIALATGPGNNQLDIAEARAVIATALDVVERGLRSPH